MLTESLLNTMVSTLLMKSWNEGEREREREREGGRGGGREREREGGKVSEQQCTCGLPTHWSGHKVHCRQKHLSSK